MPSDSIDSENRLRVVVGSSNEAKIAAVREAFALAAGSVLVNMVEVKDAPQQPLSDHDTLRGAEHRAQTARLAQPAADYWVGIEGGIERVAGELMVMAWVVILSPNRVGRSRSAAYQLPKSAAVAVTSGRSLGEVSAKAEGPDWRRRGLVASLSDGLITRSSFYVQPVILAFLPFMEAWKDFPDNFDEYRDA